MAKRSTKRPRRAARSSQELTWDEAMLEAIWLPFRWLGQACRDSVEAIRQDKWAKFTLAVLIFALFTRLVRPDWYAERQFHPDERWLFQTVAELHWPELPGKATGDGAGLQYGSLPLYAAAAVKGTARLFESNFPVNDAIKVIGRTLTGLIDWVSVLFIFMLGNRLFSRRVGALAAAFLAFTPLHIQLSHFFTVDPWASCFAIATLYGCVRVYQSRALGWCILTGIAYAAAMASKSTTITLALPILVAYAWPCLDPSLKNAAERKARILDMALALGITTAVTLVAFLTFMPMWTPAEWEKFFRNQGEQQNILITGSPEGTPFVRQYWDTGFFFHIKNLVFYYQGAALGVLGLLSLAWYAWKPFGLFHPWSQAPLKPKAKAAQAQPGPLQQSFAPVLILSWVVPYFTIVGVFSFAKFARYMLPITPFLALLAAAWIEEMWFKLGQRRALAWWLGLATLVVSFGYGTAYLGTYFRPHPWIETSSWMLGGGIPLTTQDNGVMRRTRVYNETWGDDLPVDVVGGNAGSYDNRKINIVEWDSLRKLEEFGQVCSQADAIVMADARAYGTYLRIPTRFPLTYAYFDTMMRDPGKLGFELAHQSQNHMRLFGLIDINDSRDLSQAAWARADESFTLYDRPHAFVFKKVRPITPEEAKAVLEARVKELGLPESWREGRSPSENLRVAQGISPVGSPVEDTKVNPNIGLSRGAMVPLLQPVPALTWWILMALLGVLALPLCMTLFKNFPDGGYALARALGLFLFSWLAYNLALIGLMPFYQWSLWALLALLLAGMGIWARGRMPELREWFARHKTEVIWSEAIFGGAFLFFVILRSFNPNIHDIAGQGYFGGGEPLGMTYLSAVTRCATFPVYDPWLALKDSSYYCFGYVIAGTLTKLSGFRPAITYNLSLALFFALSLLSAYGVCRALVKKRLFALAGAGAVALFGALSSVFVFVNKLAQPGIWPYSAWASHEMIWDPTRFPQLVSGHIFEFPFFSYLYGDLHPHNIVIPFGLALTALLLVPFKSVIPGWKAFGETPKMAVLWAVMLGLLLDAQYAINTWNWPVFLGLSCGTLLIGSWAGKKAGWSQALMGSLIGLVIILAVVGIPYPTSGPQGLTIGVLPTLGQGLMYGFRHYFIQDTGNRLGTVQPSEWQMVGYIPLAYFGFGLAGLTALGAMRLSKWWWSQDKALGIKQAFRRGLFDGIPKVLDRAFSRMPLNAAFLAASLCVSGLLITASMPGIWQGAVVALALGLALVFFTLFCLRGFEDGEEAFLWLIGIFTMLMVAGSEFRYVADRMNTIFKFWMNGWVLMGLAFGAGFSKWFESSEEDQPKKPRFRRKPSAPSWLPLALGGAGAALVVVLGAYLDQATLGRGWRNAPSYFALAGLLVAPGLWWSFSPWKPRLGGKAVFFGLLALGLLYPAGAILARLRETYNPDNPRLDGMAFMRKELERGPFSDVKDYDKYDAEIIDWLNAHADKTEVILEAPGVEMYKGYSRYAIYTGLPTLLGWDYQVGQQLGSRAGSQLGQRAQDAQRIYATQDPAEAIALLRKYHVRWIVVGAIERKTMPQVPVAPGAPGAGSAKAPQGLALEKFSGFCDVVLKNAGAVLYRFDDTPAQAPNAQAQGSQAAGVAP
jgi:YYY domain-containing protein